MALFALRNGLVHLSPSASRLTIQDISIRLLREKRIPCNPIPSLLSSFHKSYLVPFHDNIAPWSAFSFWDYSPQSKQCNLVFASGIDLGNHSDYPRVLGLNEGIVGALADQFLSSKSVSPRISYDYTADPLLAARSTIESLGFKAGIAVPISLSDDLSGIFKLYFKVPIDRHLKPSNPALEAIATRLTLLIRLAEDHYTRLLAATTSNAFKAITSGFSPLDSDAALHLLREATSQVVEDTAKLIGSPSARLYLLDSRKVSETELGHWAHSTKDPKGGSYFDLSLTEWNATAGAQIGRLRLQVKPNGLAISRPEERFLQEAKRLLSMNLSSFQTITDLRRQASSRTHLLHVASDIAVLLNAANSVDKIVEILTHELPLAFGFDSSHFTPLNPVAGDNDGLTDGGEASGPALLLDISGGNKCFGKLTLVGREDGDLTSDEEFLLRTTMTLAGQALWSMEVMEVVERTAREDARASLARDIVHSLTGDQSALINRIASLEPVIDKLKTDIGKKSLALRHIADLRSRLADFTKTALAQENILSRYKWIDLRGTAEPIITVDLQELRRNVVAAISHRAFQKNLKVTSRGLEKVVGVRWMRSELYLIFINLLDNAVKFSRKGGEIFFSIERDAFGCIVSIRDFGVGIHPTIRSKIWEVGFSTPAPGAAEKTSGLGLPFVKEAVDRIPGANIEVTSEKDRFTEFRLFFPREIVI